MLIASYMPGVVLKGLYTSWASINHFFLLSERSNVGNGNHKCEGIFLMRKVGCCFGCGKKREGNFSLSSDISKFRTISIPSHWF